MSTATLSSKKSIRNGEPSSPSRSTYTDFRNAFRRLQERKPGLYGSPTKQPRRRLVPG